MGAKPPPAALLEATAELIAAGPGLTDQLDAGLRGLLRLLGADRADSGLVATSSPAYRPMRIAAGEDVPIVPFEVPTADPVVSAVLATGRPAMLADVRNDLATGPVRDLLVGTGTRTIVVRRLEHNSDGCGLVCIDWVDRCADLPAEALEMVDYFVTRIWSPLLLRAVVDPEPLRPDPLAALTTAERAIVELASAGLSYREIAARRRTSINTVGQQLRSARAKVGARNTAELCALIGPVQEAS